MVTMLYIWLNDFTFIFHFPALEKEMATHSSVLAWRIPGTREPGGLPSVGSHRVGHDWRDLAVATAGGKGDDRGWDGGMASLTRWAWVWVNSGRWWWTGRPGVLRFIGSQRVGHNWATELNWTEYSIVYMYHNFFIHSSVNGHLGCFHVLAIGNSAAMNTGVHVSFSVMVSSEYMPNSVIVGLYGSFIPSFSRNLHTILRSGLYRFTFPPTMQASIF